MPAVLNVIRATWKIKKLVFVACNFESSYKNVVHLAKAASKLTPGDPFIPVRVIPVDMFPHTRHAEVIVYMERRSMNSLVAPKIEIPVIIKQDEEAPSESKPEGAPPAENTGASEPAAAAEGNNVAAEGGENTKSAATTESKVGDGDSMEVVVVEGEADNNEPKLPIRLRPLIGEVPLILKPLESHLTPKQVTLTRKREKAVMKRK